ncbi:LysE family transporter [Paenibacillus methanolicus]|uniref:Threonine/homoserine/homoserine lactone efflux protein n=1 Tax=Paenibacillus methanolicus TaxID=582686 RepID=A0A5S5BK71_9BACL|nr:LysE family transporter [Paenibacillus methanolicus]TYP67364.1 threonine/homoserine/homoserine lactone efflux protein [Paenibacillus methanolicus]
MSLLLSYMLLGFSLSAPIGPINAAQLDAGIKRGFLHSWLVGIGAMVADILYMLLVYLGFVHFMNVPFIKSFLWFFGCFVLVYTGIESLLRADKLQISAIETQVKEPLSRSFISGFLLSLSNPMTILFWVGIYGSVIAEAAASLTDIKLIICSIAILGGIMLWDLAMASIASSFRRWLSDRLLQVVATVSGCSLICFGLYFGFEAVHLMFG